MSHVKIEMSNIADEEFPRVKPRVFEMMKQPVYYSLMEELTYKEPTYWENLKVMITAPDFIVRTIFALINILTIVSKRK